MQLDIANGQTQGKRDYQQDRFSTKELTSSATLALLTDGMGGYKGGEIASKIALENFQRYFKISENIAMSLESSLHKANELVKKYKEQDPSVSSMGTTLLAVYLTETSFQWLSIGDSPLYLIRDKKIKRINSNHSVAGLLDMQVKAEEISADDANANPNRHMLTSAITGKDIPIIDISKEVAHKEGDVLVLASDGIETLSEKEILRIVLNTQNIHMISEKFLNAIEMKAEKNQDNASFICIRVSGSNRKSKKNTKVKRKIPTWLTKAYNVLGILGNLFMIGTLIFLVWSVIKVVEVTIF